MWSIVLSQVLALSHPTPPTGLVCEPIEGTLTLTPDPTCAVAASPWRPWAFPQVAFLGELGVPGVCFFAEADLDWGGEPYVGASVLGQIFNTFPVLDEPRVLATAAHVMALTDPWGDTGEVFLRHVGVVDPVALFVEEELSVQGGTGPYLGARGTLTITGNPFVGVQVSGTMCRLPWAWP